MFDSGFSGSLQPSKRRLRHIEKSLKLLKLESDQKITILLELPRLIPLYRQLTVPWLE